MCSCLMFILLLSAIALSSPWRPTCFSWLSPSCMTQESQVPAEQDSACCSCPMLIPSNQPPPLSPVYTSCRTWVNGIRVQKVACPFINANYISNFIGDQESASSVIRISVMLFGVQTLTFIGNSLPIIIWPLLLSKIQIYVFIAVMTAVDVMMKYELLGQCYVESSGSVVLLHATVWVCMIVFPCVWASAIAY